MGIQTSPTVVMEHLIKAAGQANFGDVLIDGMVSLAHSDHCTLLEYGPQDMRPTTLLSQGDLDTQLAADCAQLYDSYLFQQDPNTQALSRLTRVGDSLMFLRQRHDMKNEEYRQRLFDRCKVQQKATLSFRTDDSILSLNLYRLGRHAVSDCPLQLDWLHGFGGCLQQILQKHIQISQQSIQKCDNGASFDSQWVSARIAARFSDVLTEREREVCTHILLGYTSEAIALNLSISHNTVLTHRRNAYDKLKIGTQSQLFGLLLEGMLLPVS